MSWPTRPCWTPCPATRCSTASRWRWRRCANLHRFRPDRTALTPLRVPAPRGRGYQARMTILRGWRPRAFALAAVLAAATAAPAGAVGVSRIHHDTFTNSTSQHATEVEPDTFSHHGTTIATMQVGRFFNGGASDIGWSRSTNGTSWTEDNLPGLTAQSTPTNNFFERASDASVAYSAAHNAWLISSIPLEFGTL